MLHLVALRKNVKTNTEMFGSFVNSTYLFVIFVYKSKCLWQYMQFSKVLLIRVLGMFLVLLFILRQFYVLSFTALLDFKSIFYSRRKVVTAIYR